TGVPLMFSRRRVSQRSSIVVLGSDVMGSRVMISLAFMHPPESAELPFRYISPTLRPQSRRPGAGWSQMERARRSGPFVACSAIRKAQGVLALGGGVTSLLLFPAMESASNPSTMAPPPSPIATPQPLLQKLSFDFFLLAASCSAGVLPLSSGFFSSGFFS